MFYLIYSDVIIPTNDRGVKLFHLQTCIQQYLYPIYPFVFLAFHGVPLLVNKKIQRESLSARIGILTEQ